MTTDRSTEFRFLVGRLEWIELTTFMKPGSLLSVRVASLLDTSVHLGNYKYVNFLGRALIGLLIASTAEF